MGWASGLASGIMMGNNAIGQYRSAEADDKRRQVEEELKAVALQPATGETASRDRQLAMAGVYEKYGDVERGMGMRRDARRDELSEEAVKVSRQRFDWEKSDRSKRDADDATKRDAEKQTADWWKSRLTSQDGSMREPQPQDYLEATQHRIGMLTKAGRFEDATKAFSEHSAQAMATIHMDQAKRDEGARIAVQQVAAGDAKGVVDWLNRFVPDGSKATEARMGKDGSITVDRVGVDGNKVEPLKFKDRNQLIAAINSVRDPNALWQQSQADFQNQLALRQDARAGASLGLQQQAAGRANAEFAAGAPEREVKHALSGLQKELLAGATPERAAEINGRIVAMQGVTGKGGDQPATVKLAQAAMQAGLHSDMREALEWANGTKDKSPDAVHRQFVEAGIKEMRKPEVAVTEADEIMRKMGYSKRGNSWSMDRGGGGGGGGDLPQPKSADDLAKLPPGSRYMAPDGSIRVTGSRKASGVVQ